ncbi:SGNH/GDSL hydrolase family protein [Donghicola sp.]|jgi:lysophospholipase L1-like esterase|uniref:SGNH/GDSL hydrolase family protein n=1 Tax=Donghicola sp. TaxID=1929294 RepID=UPI0025CE0E76|nr:SGNH/GDSL hydrolase family protein [Donghicola sp.]MCT4576894.1 SGNH/GDSL hydrolase family protein [Donghicola sp.]
MSGIKTTFLNTVSYATEVMANSAGGTGRISIADLSVQMASEGEIADQLAARSPDAIDVAIAQAEAARDAAGAFAAADKRFADTTISAAVAAGLSGTVDGEDFVATGADVGYISLYANSGGDALEYAGARMPKQSFVAPQEFVGYRTPYNSDVTVTAVDAYSTTDADNDQLAPNRAKRLNTVNAAVSATPHSGLDIDDAQAYSGGTLGNDAQAWGYRYIGQDGIFTTPTVVNRIDVLFPFSQASDPDDAPTGATVQLFHVRTDDGGTNYYLVDYIGEYDAETPTNTAALTVEGLNVLMRPNDTIVVRSIGRTVRQVSNPTNAGTIDVIERLRFGNTSDTSITAIFASEGSSQPATAINNGYGPLVNFYGTQYTAVVARDVAGGVPSLDANNRIARLPAPFVKGLEDKTIVVCGTSITTGAGARQEGGLGWVELLQQYTGAYVVNEAQGSSGVVFPRSTPLSGRPRALYNVTGDAVASTNRITFDSTLASIGLDTVGDRFGFFSCRDSADEASYYDDLNRNYTITAIVDSNSVEVDSVPVDATAFITDYMAGQAQSGIIEPPTYTTLAAISVTPDELARTQDLFGATGDVSSFSYQTKILSHTPDILILDHMYNDRDTEIAAIGDITSRRRNEYLGAINWLTDRLFEQNPEAVVVLMTNFSPWRGGSSTEHEAHLLAQRDALIALAKHRCWPIIDHMFEMGAYPGQNWSTLVPDGTHPGAKMHKRISKFVLDAVLKLSE